VTYHYFSECLLVRLVRCRSGTIKMVKDVRVWRCLIPRDDLTSVLELGHSTYHLHLTDTLLKAITIYYRPVYLAIG